MGNYREGSWWGFWDLQRTVHQEGLRKKDESMNGFAKSEPREEVERGSRVYMETTIMNVDRMGITGQRILFTEKTVTRFESRLCILFTVQASRLLLKERGFDLSMIYVYVIWFNMKGCMGFEFTFLQI